MVTWPAPTFSPQDPPASKSSPSAKSMLAPSTQLRPFGVQVFPVNEPLDRPNFDVTVGRDTPLLRTMLITPAIASDPYCAEAPSRSTSM